MCTVTYIPQPNGYILTSNRDESPDRSPKNLTHVIGKNFQIGYPQDTLAGGTWIAANDGRRAVSLLNGAFVKHQHRPPYRMSRGLIPLEYFNFSDLESFVDKFELEGIEPFTLVVVEGGRLAELRWDQHKTHLKELDPNELYIWSSCTLYDEETQQKRASWFEDWKRAHDEYRLDDIRSFHQFGGEPDLENGFVMNRNNIVRTVSITQVQVDQDQTLMHYTELLKGVEDHLLLKSVLV